MFHCLNSMLHVYISYMWTSSERLVPKNGLIYYGDKFEHLNQYNLSFLGSGNLTKAELLHTTVKVKHKREGDYRITRFSFAKWLYFKCVCVPRQVSEQQGNNQFWPLMYALFLLTTTWLNRLTCHVSFIIVICQAMASVTLLGSLLSCCVWTVGY